jgi:aspartyl-tRNA(Asn)/glutamyl-tRNA(Gln) amidotransferase subunit B
LGLPGALPVLNAEAVRMAVRTALALSCAIREHSRFARKNYFYPDLPKGYQISQYDEPFSEKGHLDIVAPPRSGGEVAADAPEETKRIGITRVHMEEDAGKNLHGASSSVVDLNRAGTPLVEIVGEPDLRSGADAAEYLRSLRDVLVFIGVNDGNLEEGSFRCDANVSIRPVGSQKLGTRVELKNINSFRFVQKAIDHEIARQEAVIASGGTIVQETRGWNEVEGKTFSLRSKEEAQDYRYFPEPDLPPLLLEGAFVERVRAALPELPRDKRARFVDKMHLTAYAAQVMTGHPRIAAFFEETAILHGHPVKVANFVQGEVLRDVETRGLEAKIPVTPMQLAALLKLVDAGTISGKQAKDVYAKTRGTDRMPEAIVDELGMKQVTDVAAIEAVCNASSRRTPNKPSSSRAGRGTSWASSSGK